MRKERQRIAEETLQILEAGGYESPSGAHVDLGEAIRRCVTGTTCYSPEKLEGMVAAVRKNPEHREAGSIEVSEETTLAGAFRLAEAGPEGRLGVLNFASARKPGGGFKSGAGAQEESLARSSGLVKSLSECLEFYDYHRRHKSLLYSDRLIYSPECPVFRGEDGRLLDTPYYVDVVSCAAPNAAALKREHAADAQRIEEVLRERIGKVLAAAYSHGCRNLVLGAWGCGVFGNDPMMVARLFREYVGQGGMFERKFEQVLFAVFDAAKNRPRYRAFSRVLSVS